MVFPLLSLLIVSSIGELSRAGSLDLNSHQPRRRTRDLAFINTPHNSREREYASHHRSMEIEVLRPTSPFNENLIYYPRNRPRSLIYASRRADLAQNHPRRTTSLETRIKKFASIGRLSRTNKLEATTTFKTLQFQVGDPAIKTDFPSSKKSGSNEELNASSSGNCSGVLCLGLVGQVSVIPDTTFPNNITENSDVLRLGISHVQSKDRHDISDYDGYASKNATAIDDDSPVTTTTTMRTTETSVPDDTSTKLGESENMNFIESFPLSDFKHDIGQ